MSGGLFELEQLAVAEAMLHEGACCDPDDLAAVELYERPALPLHLPFEPGLPPLFGGRCGVCGGSIASPPADTYVMQRQGFVKIGRSKHPETRLRELQAIGRQRYIVTPPAMDCTEPLLLLVVLPGDIEHELHERFASCHVVGEWFLPDLELRAWLDRCCGGRS